MSNSRPLLSRVAIVTGAAQGIGEGVALRLAEDGFDVTVVDLPAKREQVEAVVRSIQSTGRRALRIVGDMSLEIDVVSMVDKTVQDLGGLDVMVANAGICRPGSILDLTVEEFDEMMTVNARSVMLAIKHAGRQMVKQGRGGRIIGAASWAAKQALELRKYDITVNAYAPGLIITALSTLPEDDVNGGPGSTLMKKTGLSSDLRPGMPKDVAGLVSYIAKPEAWYITGQCININGGLGME
ncbi:NAD-P-binding protein [Trametes punicea]|nr:NAD-P-binding protein [Trametes punicea]